MIDLTIVHYGGSRKTVSLEDITPAGWIQVRYCFSLIHGRIEAKRGEEPAWSLLPADLVRCQAIAEEKKIKPRKQRAPNRPRAPKQRPPSKQVDMYPGEEG